MKKTFKHLLVYIITLISILTGCSTTTKPESSQSNTNNFNIVTSFYPIYILTLNIAGGIDGVNVVNMAQPQTGCLHDYQLTTGDMKKLDSADAFIINGAGMECFLNNALKLYPNLEIIDSSNSVKLIKSANQHHHEDDDNHNEEYNSHIWLSVDNAIKQSEYIKDCLCSANPANVSNYTKNADEFISKLEMLSKEMKDKINPEHKNIKVATFHEAFDYIANDYGLTIAESIDLDENVQPSTKAFAQAIKTIKAENITILLTGDDAGTKIAETVAAETNASVYRLDPITSGELNADAYIDLMRKNLETLQEAVK